MRYCFLRFPDGKPKALTLSYDDGVVQDKRLIETLNKYGIKATLNINSQRLISKAKNSLTCEEISKLVASGGHEIAAHGAYHIALGNAIAQAGICDVLDGRRELERIFGSIIRGFAYPDTGITHITNGTSKEEIAQYLKNLGIAYARSLLQDNNRFDLPQNWYEWIPTAKHTNPRLMEYLEQFIELEIPQYIAARDARLFYLWGHSYEFDNDNNWDVLENFCKAASNKDDIWYATNIEIYDYITAYRALQFNLDRTMVHNPTCKKIWFDFDGKLFSVNAGETIKIED